MIEFPILLDAKNLIIVFVAVIHAALGIVISIKGSGKKQNSIFAIMEFFLILWSIAMIFYRSSYGDEITLWVKLLYFAAIMVPYIFIYFTYAFPEDKTKEFSKIVQILLPIPIFIITWMIFWDKLIIGVNSAGSGEPVIIFYKGAEYAYAAYMWGYFALAYLRLIKLYFESSGQTKAQIKFVFLGTFFSTILATSSNMLLPIFGIFYLNWFGQVSIVAMASHQLRTPLTVIKGYISMIQEGSFGKVADPLSDALRKIYISNETLINLVGDFLNLSRIESGKMKYTFEPTQMEGIIQSVFEEFMEVVKEKKLE